MPTAAYAWATTQPARRLPVPGMGAVGNAAMPPLALLALPACVLQAGECPVPYTNATHAQNCNATILAKAYTILTKEDCYDKKDNNGDGLTDWRDPECQW
jgi:hypothetical protein